MLIPVSSEPFGSSSRCVGLWLPLGLIARELGQWPGLLQWQLPPMELRSCTKASNRIQKVNVKIAKDIAELKSQQDFLYLFATENSPPTRPPPHDRLIYYSIFKSFTEKICEKYELTGILQASSLVRSSRWDITTID
jgi:hypothetical protein